MPMVQMTSPTFSRQDWLKGYETLKTEQAYWVDEVEGSIPSELEGTLFRNGPGQFDINGEEYGHPFDGDGMICAIAFKDGKAHFTNQFVQTPELLAEQKAGKILYRSVFGTQRSGGWLNNIFDVRIKNPANTSVVYHGGKLLSLCEVGLPYSLDSQNLQTLGVEDFGILPKDQPFTAHPRRDDRTGDLWCFGVKTGLQSTISIYRFTEQGKLSTESEVKVAGFCFLHDFVVTPNYRIFIQNPFKFKSVPFLLGFATAGACLELDPHKPSQILLVDRQGNLQTLDTESCFIFHHCNAYEEGDEIILDSVCYPDYLKAEPNSSFRDVDFSEIPCGHLYRFTINPKLGTVTRRLVLERSCEFPVVAPRCVGQKHRYTYLATIAKESEPAPFQAIAKVDLETGKHEIHNFAPRGFVGEPIFVPRDRRADSAEDDGWVLTLVFDGERNRSDLVVLDAQNIAGKPVAILHLKHHVPYGFHGSFTPNVF
ncbi:Apocarotenoid-15,15'-oxygenase [Pseudanabaena biceps]|nr:Apocarotenoid-15,15'-oxygenase [Pseudanabaena biceps]